MNLGEMIANDLRAQIDNVDFLPSVLAKNIPLYFANVFRQYSEGGFIYEGEVTGTTYSYPMKGKDYSISTAVTPPIFIEELKKMIHGYEGFWVPLFKMIGEYIIKCKITFVNLTSGLSVPFVIGWDEASKKAQAQNSAILEETAISLPGEWAELGASFDDVVQSTMFTDTEELWSLFGDYVEKGIDITMNWTFSVTTLKTPAAKNQGAPGTFTGDLQVHFTNLP